MFIPFILLFLLFSLIFFMTRKQSQYWGDRGFLSVPTKFLMGNMKGVGTSVASHERFKEIYQQYKGRAEAIGIFMFVTPALVVLDLELAKNIFIRDFSSFHNRGFYYNKEDDPLSANLLTLEGQEWKERRTKLSPIFTSGKMKMMFEIVDSIGDKLIEAVDKEIVINENTDAQVFLARFTTDVISSVAFGIDSNCLNDPDSEFYKHGKRLFDLTTIEFIKLIYTAAMPKLSRKLHLTINPTEPTNFLHKVFLETIKAREESNIKRNDYVQLLLNIRDSLSMTNDEMAAEAFIFFEGGFETSSTTLTFSLYELAMHQDVQQRLRTEIQDKLEENDGKLTYEMLFSFEYLDCVVKETLRKYPVIPALMRKCENGYQLPGKNLRIPKNTNVIVPIYAIQHDPEYYPSPEEFDPERFSPENSKNRHPMTFLTFGDGPRNCIGERFGLLQVKLGLVKLLTNFDFSVCSKTTIPMKFKPTSPFVTPIDGMTLKIKRLISQKMIPH